VQELDRQVVQVVQAQYSRTDFGRRQTMRKLFISLTLFVAVVIVGLYLRPRRVLAIDYRIINVSNAIELGAIINGVTPGALPASTGVHSATVRFDGIVAATDHVVGWEVPAPTANCPLIGVRVTADNQLTADWVSITAAACTPTAGTYKVLILRF
jgi:hypothetical protein